MAIKKCSCCGTEFNQWAEGQVMCFECIRKINAAHGRKRPRENKCTICGKNFISSTPNGKTCSKECLAKLRKEVRLNNNDTIVELIKKGRESRVKKEKKDLTRPFSEDTVYLVHKWYYEYVNEPTKMESKKAIKLIASILGRSEANIKKALEEKVPIRKVLKWEELNFEKCKFGGNLIGQESKN